MIVHRISHLTGKINCKDIPITPQQLVLVENRGHQSIQDIVPHLTNEDREFLMTGMTNSEWEAAFPPEEKE